MCRRILKNRPPPEEPEIDLYKLPMMKSTSVQRQSIHSINGAIGNELTGLSTCWAGGGEGGVEESHARKHFFLKLGYLLNLWA